MLVLPNCVILRPVQSFLPKVVSTFHCNWEIELSSFAAVEVPEAEQDWKRLDLVSSLRIYVERTAPFRTVDNLFVLPVGARRGQAACLRTLSSWIVRTIALAYQGSGLSPPDQLLAHSTRSMAASWAALAGVSVTSICKAASWSTPNMFLRHYRLDVRFSPESLVGVSILSTALTQ